MKPKSNKLRFPNSLVGLSTLSLALATTVPIFASSHSDAPLIKQDPQANLTDVYAFIGNKYDSGAQPVKVLNVMVSIHPFSEPGDGAIYEKFSDDALYSIHITNPSTGAENLRYDFKFSDINPLTAPGLKNPNTILSYGRGTEIGDIQVTGDARQNYTQTYSVEKNGAQIATGLKVPPPNVGLKTTPDYNDADGNAISGATTFAGLDKYTEEAVFNAGSEGEAVFAGPREDGFYSDIPGIFDLLDGRIIAGNSPAGLGQAGGGIDGFKGFNVLTFAIQIPLSELTPSTYTAAFANIANGIANGGAAQNTGVGVYASVSRKRITLRRSNAEALNVGQWIQVNRLGNPLFNEALVALKDKDKFNRTFPMNDASYNTYAVTPELPVLINAVFGTEFVTTGRGDLGLVFIPDVLRVDTTTPAVRLPDQPGHSRNGFVGGDVVVNGAGRTISSGWPNGRRPGDDVIDIALTAVASGPSYSTVTVLGDNVEENDQSYNQVFPYLGTPHAGTTTNQRQAPASAP
ncbi:MAG: DUF4331 domain-containing protein [Armatimonadetes bacterium]|nr:DUF4331 domain-containing protein [Akkermansiaceae bacterium]